MTSRKTGWAWLLALPMLTGTPAVLADVIHPLGGLDPAGIFNVNNPASWFRGWEFSVNTNDITVTELGMRMPTAGQTVILELWDNSTQALIASTGPVVTETNTWQYFSLGSSVALANGGVYTVGILAVTPNAAYYYADNLPPQWYPTGDIEYRTMRYHNAASSQFPTLTLAGFHYGVADIGYVIPGPASIALLALGFGAISPRRRRL